MDETKIRQIVRDELRLLFGSDRYTFQKHLQIFDGRNIQTGRTTGTQIATAADQKLGFFGVTPIVQPAAPADLAAVKTVLHDLGLTA